MPRRCRESNEIFDANNRPLYPGSHADIGDFRLSSKQTKRTSTNKWQLYLEIRTHIESGLNDDLKRRCCVAEFPGALTLDQVEQEACSCLLGFLSDVVAALENTD